MIFFQLRIWVVILYFLVESDPTKSVLASNYITACISSSIYYGGDNFCVDYYTQFEIFNLEDGSVAPCLLPEGYDKRILASWVVPTMGTYNLLI